MSIPTAETARHSTAHASRAILGVKLRQLDRFGPIRERVRVAQKTVRHTPGEKLYDAFITLLTGAHGLVELNRCLRADPGLQAAFGRAACAEQSVVQDTLDACTAANVAQMEQALEQLYREQRCGYRHDYDRAWQILDVDVSGLPCGKKSALATTGYFAKQRRRGRQLGRVLATAYQAVVVDRRFAGNTPLRAALQPLVLAAEQTLGLDGSRRRRTILRVDAGAGGVTDIKGVLERGYHVVAKDCATARARRLAASVTCAGREVDPFVELVLLDDEGARFVPEGDGFVRMGTGDGRAFRPAQQFSSKDCGPCPHRPACCRAQGRSSRRTRCLRPRVQFEALLAARRRASTTAFGEPYTLRTGIAGTLARAIVGSRRSTRPHPHRHRTQLTVLT